MSKSSPAPMVLASLCVLSLSCGSGGDRAAPSGSTVEVLPSAAEVAPGATISFNANVSVTWSVQEGSTGGDITASGAYTAPLGTGRFHVIATSAANPAVSGSAVVTVTASPPSLASNLAVLSGVAIYFGHQSVGANLMDGVRALLASNSGTEPTVITSSAAADMQTGTWAEDYNGSNYDPEGKISSFQSTLIANGVGAKVDVAFMKFCWVDFDDSWYWEPSPNGGGATVASLFAKYQAMVAAVHHAYPNLKLVHFTAPLYADDVAQNQRRESYNALVRSTYDGVEPVFDLALRESTDPNGNRVIGTYGPRLYSGYTSDGGHLNTNLAQGRDRFAADLVALLAGI